MCVCVWGFVCVSVCVCFDVIYLCGCASVGGYTFKIKASIFAPSSLTTCIYVSELLFDLYILTFHLSFFYLIIYVSWLKPLEESVGKFFLLLTLKISLTGNSPWYICMFWCETNLIKIQFPPTLKIYCDECFRWEWECVCNKSTWYITGKII